MLVFADNHAESRKVRRELVSPGGRAVFSLATSTVSAPGTTRDRAVSRVEVGIDTG